MPSKAELKQKWNNAGKDKVVLHMFPRSKFRPNPSPFPLKFETYLRMAGIEYEVDFTQPMGSKGKTPWMTFNGEEMSDSQLCIEYLGEKLEKDLSKDLSPAEKAVARSMRIMMEDHFYWCGTTMEFVHNKGKFMKSQMQPFGPSFLQGFFFNMMLKNINKQAHAQGMGRHKKEEVEKLAIQDLKTISDYLGDKPFLMGNDPTEVDATVWAFLALFFATDPEANELPVSKALEEMTNLKDYFNRIKEKYYEDWDELLWKEEPKKKREEKKEEEDKDKDKEDEEDKDKDKEKEEEKKEE